MRAKRKSLFVLIAAFVFTLFAAIGLAAKNGVTAAGAEGSAAVEGTGKSFGADESFAFAAKAEYATAESAGLVFGKTDSEFYAFLVNRKENRVKLVKNGGGLNRFSERSLLWDRSIWAGTKRRS